MKLSLKVGKKSMTFNEKVRKVIDVSNDSIDLKHRCHGNTPFM